MTRDRRSALAVNLKDLMQAYGITAEKLAVKIGCDAKPLQALLGGETATPDVFLVADIAGYFELYIDDLLHRSITLDLMVRRLLNRQQ